MALIRRNENERSLTRAQPQGWDPFEMMRQMMSWDPFAELSRSFTGGAGFSNFNPSFELKETKDAFVFKADLPGVKEDDLEVSLTGNRLTVSGKRDEEVRQEDDRYFAYERSFGAFSRSFTLPSGADADHVDADLKSGVLTLVVPKKPEAQPKRIQLKSGEKAKA